MTDTGNDTVLSKSEAEMLDQFFADAAVDHPDGPDDLMARGLADGLENQPTRQVQSPTAQDWLQSVLSGIGGLPGAGGLVAAGITGLWIGVSPPEILEINASGLWDYFGTDLTAGWSNNGDIL